MSCFNRDLSFETKLIHCLCNSTVFVNLYMTIISKDEVFVKKKDPRRKPWVIFISRYENVIRVRVHIDSLTVFHVSNHKMLAGSREPIVDLEDGRG